MRSTLGKEYVTRSAINSCIKRMKPKVQAIQVFKQGSSDPFSNWAMARKSWVHQLLLRLRVKTWEVTSQGHPPTYFDISKLGPPIKLAAIVYFDEMHK